MALPSAVRQRANAVRKQFAGSQDSSRNASNEHDNLDPSTMGAITGVHEDVTITRKPADDPTLLSVQSDGSANQAANDKGSEPIDPQDWKARYTAFRDARDNEKEELKVELSQVRTENGQLRAENTQLKAEIDQLKGAGRPSFELSEEERAELGDKGASAVEKLHQHVDQQFEETRTQQLEESTRIFNEFKADLTSLVPYWEKLNKRDDFLQWCSQVDPAVGLQRQTILDGLVNNRDANSVARFFNQFAATRVPESQQRAPGSDAVFETEVSRAGSGEGQDELHEHWSESEIADFFARKGGLQRAGKLRDPAVRQRIEAEEERIRIAMANDRIIKG